MHSISLKCQSRPSPHQWVKISEEKGGFTAHIPLRNILPSRDKCCNKDWFRFRFIVRSQFTQGQKKSMKGSYRTPKTKQSGTIKWEHKRASTIGKAGCLWTIQSANHVTVAQCTQTFRYRSGRLVNVYIQYFSHFDYGMVVGLSISETADLVRGTWPEVFPQLM